MKPPRLRHLAPILLGSLAGFLLTLLLGRGWPSADPALPEPATPAAVPVRPPPDEASIRRRMETLTAEAALPSPPSPDDVLALAREAGAFSDEQMAQWLDSTGREKDQALARLVLLLRWAHRNPEAVMTWLTTHGTGKGMLPGNYFGQIIRRCLATDTKSVLEWYRRLAPENPHLKGFAFSLAMELSEINPLEAARFCEEMNVDSAAPWKMDLYMPSVHDFRPLVELALKTLEPLKLPKWDGGYRKFDQETRRFRAWEAVFQTALVNWHDRDPVAYGQWLATQSEELQHEARWLERRSVHRDHDEMRTEAAKTEAASAAEPPAIDPTTPPSAEAFPDARNAWTTWWKNDAAAAEAFLQQSAWPEDLKFRARADAYAPRR